MRIYLAANFVVENGANANYSIQQFACQEVQPIVKFSNFGGFFQKEHKI